MELRTFRDFPRFGVKGAPERLPKAYYSKLLLLLGRKGTHFGRNVWIPLKFPEFVIPVELCEIRITSWILMNMGPSAPPTAKPIGNLWYFNGSGGLRHSKMRNSQEIMNVRHFRKLS